MKIRLLSDLHLEGGDHKELYASLGEDVLVIAGDLSVGANAVWSALKKFAEHQPNIVYTYGNHEFYRQDYFDTCRKLEDWAKYTSIKILNPGVTFYCPEQKKLVDHKDLSTYDGAVPFIGAPLWTNFRNNDLSKLAAARGINDFRLIEFDNRYFSPNDAAKLFDSQFGYIKCVYEECSQIGMNGKKVIVTHFLPAVECIDAQYLGQGATSTLNDYFANDLGGWISWLEDTTWLHGHTHSNVDVTIGSTRIIANPYGYGTNKYYKEKLIDIS